MGARPDVLIIVMDCVRASDFPPLISLVHEDPFLSDFRREAVAFQRAATVAPWTLPAHASLFSGLYPWQHGVMARGMPKLPTTVITLATRLSRLGYSSIALSANPFISPLSGLTSGFEECYWGSWSSHYFPFLSSKTPLGQRSSLSKRYWEKLRTWTDLMPQEILDSTQVPFPSSWKRVNQWTAKINSRLVRRMHPTASWIERILGARLSSTPEDRPVFAFVNLLDAHEPYFPTAEMDLEEDLELDRASQLLDGFDRNSKHWTPDDPTMILLHKLYRASIEALMARVSGLLRLFKSRGRWNRTLVVLTSDHGQAFGEGGSLFHTLGDSEEHLRVPLFVRFPDGQSGGVISDTWASLVDIVPTIETEVGLDDAIPSSGEPLQGIIREQRKTPIFAVADGATSVKRQFVKTLSRQSAMNVPRLIGYEGSIKLIADVNRGEIKRAQILGEPPMNQLDSSDDDPAETTLTAQIRDVLGVLRSPRFEGGMDPFLARRLTSWGYD
jgi:arylsulfatase A-like enzyme